MRSEVQIFPDPPFSGARRWNLPRLAEVNDRRERTTDKVVAQKDKSGGAIAQLGERLPCTQEVGGSIPPGSTTFCDGLLQTVKNFDREMIFLSVFAL